MKFSMPWQIYALIAVAIALPLIQRLVEAWLEQRRFDRAGLADLKRMSWRDFEKYLAHLFRALGYKVELTPPSGDFGIDVLLIDGSGRRIAVQAKRWKGKKVGAPEVQRTIGGAKFYRCEQSIVVTTSGYTDQAREVARRTDVQLWGLKELGDAMELARSRGAAAQAEVAVASTTVVTPRAKLTLPKPAGNKATGGQSISPTPIGMPVKATAPATPTCPQCGAAMVERSAQGPAIWLCSRFPICKGNRPK